jgi:GMP synthase (glutamine-hydrolysing)
VRPVLLVRNDGFESFGVAAPSLAWAGVDIVTVDAAGGVPLPPLDAVSGVVMFGGTANVDEVRRYPHLATVRTAAREAVDRGLPYLGICLGAQLLARALDVPVVRSHIREIGFEPIRPTPEAAADPLLSLYADGDLAVQWHEDTFDLPPGAMLLATGDLVGLQAFRVAERAWGIQFHQEVDAVEFDAWVDLAQTETDLAATWGKGPERLRAEAAEHMAAHEARGRELFRRFADVVRGRAG